MSSDALPITSARFAAALSDLPLASLRLKSLELRNSLAHLAYSNAQLRPFADGLQPGPDGTVRESEPDPDCIEAIRENEIVMARMRERVLIVRAEVERRGVSWREFEVPGDDDDEPGVGEQQRSQEEEGRTAGGSLTNGRTAAAGGDDAAETSTLPYATAPARGGGSNPWTDGTFQTGVIRNGEVHMDAVSGQRAAGGVATGAGTASATSSTAVTTTATTRTGGGGGGRLTDEELRRMLEERLAEDGGDEEDGGLHL